MVNQAIQEVRKADNYKLWLVILATLSTTDGMLIPSGLLTLHMIRFLLLATLAYKSYLGRVQICNILFTGICLFLLIALHIVHAPLVSRTNQPDITSCNRTTSKNAKRKRKHDKIEKDDDNKQLPNPKRKGNPTYHPDRQSCSPCALWSQSGNDVRLKSYHPTSNSRHAGTEALPLSQYASFSGTQFDLNYNDCVCRPCYMDYLRNKNNSENVIPRWEKIRQEVYKQPKADRHCVYCCGTLCECENTIQWGPECWYGVEGIKVWKQFLSLTGKVDYAIGNHVNHVCRTHHRRILHLRSIRTCSVCTCKDSSNWNLICNITNSPDKICEAFSLEPEAIQFFDWICEQCSLSYSNDERFLTTLSKNMESSDPIIAHRSHMIDSSLTVLKNDGIIFTKEVKAGFKKFLINSNVETGKHPRLCNTLAKYLNTATQNCYKTFIPPNNERTLGKVIYDAKKFSIDSLNFILRLKKTEWERSDHISIQELQKMVKQQVSRFPNARNFDYSQLLSEDGVMELDSYYDPKLVSIIDAITMSTHLSTHTCSKLYQDLRTCRIKMIISLLCFTMDPRCCYLQTLTGLLCYAYGLRDKGFEALNAFGCLTGIDHIRAHGSFWASKRSPIDELDVKKLWRMTLDNLNFHIKYAKNLPEAATGSKKMLNLITGQVSHENSGSKPNKELNNPPKLSEIVHKSVCMQTHSIILAKPAQSVSVDDFMNHKGTNENYYYEYFIQACYLSVLNRLPQSPIQHTQTFIESVQNLMPHWTPKERDNIVYATIVEAMSSSITDIETYLLQVKRDLHISESGYPAKVVMAGDQQTYALMKDLQRQYPDHYSWIIILHGDWHTLQLLAEIIRDTLWDGGLKQLAHECGQKKLPTQWQDVHMFLLALHEALMRKALLAYVSDENDTNDPHFTSWNKFWRWIQTVQASTNMDEVSRFWAKLLPFLNAYVGYYVSIRSGNWLLRNACLRTIAPLFFAFNHYKYEELCTMAIKDTLTLPTNILQHFLNGGWTVSIKGRPHHNFALDEAHESVINLRLKTITSRPSHFRTVELANFMSYLDKVVRGMENMLYQNKQKEPSHYRKRYVCQRTGRMMTMLKDVMLFKVSDIPKQLCNILWTDKRPLDSKTIDDLLNIANTGIERMQHFVKEYTLPPQSTGPRKRRKRTRKLATFTHKTTTMRESKKREQELTNIAKNAMEILQANRICKQTSQYPLAIADIQGNMRSSQKSKFLGTLTQCLQFDRAVTEVCPLILHPPQDLCVIVDG